MKQIVDPKDLGTVLRCRATKRYFTEEGWSADLSQAKTFPNEEEAMRAILAHNLRDVELVLWAAGARKQIAATPAVRRPGQ